MARPKKIPHKKRSDGTYEAKVTIGYDFNDKPIRKSFYSSESWEKAKAEGERYKIERELAERRGEIMTKDNITFRQVAEECMPIFQQKIRANTFETHSQMLNTHILPYFGDWQVRNIRKADISKYFVVKSNFTESTLKVHKGIIRKILQYAVDSGYIYANPADHLKIEVGKKERVKEILDSNQMKVLIDLCKVKPNWLTVGILIQAEYGLSRSEVLGIMREDVDIENKIIHIQRSVSLANNGVQIEDTKNKYRNRLIPISDDVLKIIVNDPMFYEKDFIVSPDGNVCRPDVYAHHFRKFFVQKVEEGHDIKVVTPHALRHSRASLWVAEEKNLFAIAETFGWSDLDMLRKRYGHADIEAIRKQLDI